MDAIALPAEIVYGVPAAMAMCIVTLWRAYEKTRVDRRALARAVRDARVMLETRNGCSSEPPPEDEKTEVRAAIDRKWIEDEKRRVEREQRDAALREYLRDK